eukprot:g5612.t1
MTRESFRIKEVRRQLAPKGSPPQPERKEKKKWETVATGTYFRDGAHVETRWGKFGEAGGMHRTGSEGSAMEEEEEDKFEEEVELTESINISVQSPERISKNLAWLKLGREDSFVDHGKKKPCGWFTDFWKLWLLALLCCLLLVGLIILCIVLTGDYNENFESNVKDCH